MRFQMAGQYTQGQADIDPVAAPETALRPHIMIPKEDYAIEEPTKLMLALIGSGAETLTLDLYFLIEDFDRLNRANPDVLINTDRRWFQFDSGLVVTNGTLSTVTADLPNRGIIYGRRTADSIGASATRQLLAAWA